MKKTLSLLLFIFFNSSLSGETLEELEMLFFENPTDIGVNLRLAKEATKSGDFDTAIATYERLIIFEEQVVEHHLNLIELYLSLKMYLQAEMTLDEAVRVLKVEDKRVELLREKIDSRKKHSFWGVGVSFYGGYSSNPLSAPEVEDIELYLQDERVLFLDGEEIESIIESSNFYGGKFSISNRYDIGLIGGFYLKSSLYFMEREYQQNRELKSALSSFNSSLGYSFQKSDLLFSVGVSAMEFGEEALFDSYKSSLLWKTLLNSGFKVSNSFLYQFYRYKSSEERDSYTLNLSISKPFREFELFNIGGAFSESGVSRSRESEPFDRYLEATLFAKYSLNYKDISVKASGEFSTVEFAENISLNQSREREDVKRSLNLSGGYSWRVWESDIALSLNYLFQKSSSNLRYINSQKEEIFLKLEISNFSI